MLEKLPVEVSCIIFQKLTGKELTVLSAVCKSWRILINEDRLWKDMCEAEGIPDENVPEDLLSDDDSDDETEESSNGDGSLARSCHWWSVYKFWHLRRKNWLHDGATSHKIYFKLTDVSIRGCLMATTSYEVPGAVVTDITRLRNDDFECCVQDRVALGFHVNHVEVGVGSLAAIINGYWALIYTLERKRFILTAFVNLIDSYLENLDTESVQTKEENLFVAQILIIVEHFVWFKTARRRILVAYRGEESKIKLNEIKLVDVAAVSTDEKNVAVLRPECVQVHDLIGSLLFTLNKPGYYSGLTMNCGRLAFLCTQNFDGPLPHVYDIQTRSFLKLPKEWPYEVYKLALAFKGRFLLCFHRISLTCFCLDGPPGTWRSVWDIAVGGSMYIRSGTTLMEVVCNRVVLFSPGLGRMNDTFHVGLMTGQMLRSTSRLDCLYAEGLIRVSHSGAVVRDFDKNTEIYVLRNYTT